LRATFNALPPFLPGKDFLDVRDFITKEVSDLASACKPEVSKRQDDSTVTSTRVSQSCKEIQKHTSSDELQLKPTSSATLAGADVNSKPKSVIEDKIKVPSNPSASFQPSVDAVPQGLAESVVALEKDHPADHSSEGSTKRMGDGGAGAGRGAKNLAALMQRAAGSKEQGEIDHFKEPSGIGNKSSTTNDPVSKENQTSISSETKLQDNPTTNAAKTLTSTSESGTTEGPAFTNPRSTNDTSGSPPPQQQQFSTESGMGRGIGRGKGFGTKNLAAMRSRVSKTDDIDGEI
jgi:hypothetical protein